MIFIMSVVVITLRALPFLVFRGGQQKLPPLLDYLGKVLTAAAIAMLCVYRSWQKLGGPHSYSPPRNF